MILGATCHITFASDAPISAVMMLRPRSGCTQWITREEYASGRVLPVVEYADNFWEPVSASAHSKGMFDVRYSCRAHTADVEFMMKVTVEKAASAGGIGTS